MVSAKSSGVSWPACALRISSLYAAKNVANSRVSARLMLGTTRPRDPSRRCTSTATPKLTCSATSLWGAPSISTKSERIRAFRWSAFTIAHASRWVKLTLPPVNSARCWFMSVRFSSSRRTGIVRTELAVGTERLACMFSTRRRAGPIRGTAAGATSGGAGTLPRGGAASGTGGGGAIRPAAGR